MNGGKERIQVEGKTIMIIIIRGGGGTWHSIMNEGRRASQKGGRINVRMRRN